MKTLHSVVLPSNSTIDDGSKLEPLSWRRKPKQLTPGLCMFSAPMMIMWLSFSFPCAPLLIDAAAGWWWSRWELLWCYANLSAAVPKKLVRCWLLYPPELMKSLVSKQQGMEKKSIACNWTRFDWEVTNKHREHFYDLHQHASEA